MKKHYVIKKTVLETYGITAENRKEAIAIMKSGDFESPATITILKEVLVKSK